MLDKLDGRVPAQDGLQPLPAVTGTVGLISNGTSNGSNAANSTHDEMNGSPNGNGRASVESASDDEREGRIRVGKDYQAVTPNFIEVESKH